MSEFSLGCMTCRECACDVDVECIFGADGEFTKHYEYIRAISLMREHGDSYGITCLPVMVCKPTHFDLGCCPGGCCDASRNEIESWGGVTILPKRYRKLPVEVEAIQNASISGLIAILNWAGDNVTMLPDGRVVIHTLEGDMAIGPGDWVIHGVKGEFYPCKADVFAATYEEVV